MAESKVEYWKNKLVGKTLVENDEATSLSEDQIVRIQEIPSPHRILPPNAPMTRDYRQDRLNVFIDDNKKIENVYYA